MDKLVEYASNFFPPLQISRLPDLLIEKDDDELLLVVGTHQVGGSAYLVSKHLSRVESRKISSDFQKR